MDSKLCSPNVGVKPVSGERDPLYGINKRTLSFGGGKNIGFNGKPGQPVGGIYMYELVPSGAGLQGLFGPIQEGLKPV